MNSDEIRSAGYRDGQDCALLEREMRSPFPKDSSEYEIYKLAWEEGYEVELKAEGL